MLNRVLLIGHVGKDPEIRTMQDGREVATFSLATSESWKDKNSGERKSKTEWHNVVVFNPSVVGVIKSYVKKGSKIYLEGSLQTRKWQAKDGSDRYTTEIVMTAFGGVLKLLDSKSEGPPKVDCEQEYAATSNVSPGALDDEIAF